MPQIQAPMLAQSFDPDKCKFPLAATPKLDGIRCLKVNGEFLSRSFKKIRNTHIYGILQSLNLPDGVDGELIVGNSFNETSSAVMSIKGEPNFTYYIFDYVDSVEDYILPYLKRVEQLVLRTPNSPYISLVLPEIVYDLQDLYSYKESLSSEYEGVILRDPESLYEFKRSKALLKVKDFIDDEATIIGFIEKMSNKNPQQFDNFGYSKRSASKEGLVGTNTLGSILVKDSKGREFKIGSGFDDRLRLEIWKNQDNLLGKLVKFKYMTHGTKSLPRHPIFLGFRHPEDLS